MSKLLSLAAAERVSKLDSDDISAIIKLASLGQSARAILDHAIAMSNGDEPELNFEPGAPRTLVIQAWSFVKDRKQYEGVYGLSSAQAGELADLLESDSAEAVAKIRSVVSERLMKTGSTRPVRVTLEGAPKSVPGRPGAPPAGDGGLSLLREEIRRNSGVYGSYQYTADPTGRSGSQSFYVHLGGSIYAVGQSKAVAVCAARIASVKGRADPLVQNHIVYWPQGGKPQASNDIPLTAFDARRGPFDDMPEKIVLRKAKPGSSDNEETTTK